MFSALPEFVLKFSLCLAQVRVKLCRTEPYMEQAALLCCTAGLPSALAVAGEGEHALLESFLSPISLAWAPSGHLSVNQFRKLCRGSPVCFLSLAPDCSIPSVLTSLPWWQEAEQLGVSPLSSTSVTPAPGWLQFWTATSSQKRCMALLLLIFFLTTLTLLGLPALTAGAVRLWQ